MRYYLKVMKDIIRSGSKGDGAGGAAAGLVAGKVEVEVRRLNEVVQEREEEIAQLKKALLHAQQQPLRPQQPSNTLHTRPSPHPSSTSSSSAAPTLSPYPPAAFSDLSLDSFRQQYAQHEQLEQRKDELNELIRAAKSLGESINASKQHILHLKQRLTAHTLNRTLAQQDNQPADALAAMEAAERAVVGEMEDEKRRYRDRFGELKAKKEEIVHLQGAIERGRRKMEVEFERWKRARADTQDDDASDDRQDEEQQQDRAEVEVQRGNGKDESQRQRQQQQLSVGRSMDKRPVHEEVKEQVIPTPRQQQQRQPHQTLPANAQPTGRDAQRPIRPQPSVHSSTPVASPSRTGALSSLMLGQSAATAAVSGPSAATGGNSFGASGGSGASRPARTGNAAADAEIDKFWALRDKLKSHAATVQSTLSTALK